jgi:hypothetical protein
VGIDLSPSQVVPKGEEITVINLTCRSLLYVIQNVYKELYQQLSSVDLNQTVYKTPHVALHCQGFNQITSMDTHIVGVGMWLASLLWERVYPAVA